MSGPSRAEGGLAARAIVRLKAILAEGGSFPSTESELALASLLGAMEDALNGRLQSKSFLSSIDPGMGKSRGLAAFLNEWVTQGRKPDNGVLVCVSTRYEIEQSVEAAGLPIDQFGVFTSDERLNALGLANAKSAPVLFTTQQMVDRRQQSSKLWDYRGHPRRLKIWDEAMSPAAPVTVARDKLGGLLDYRLYAPDLVPLLEVLMDAVREAAYGDVLSLSVGLVREARAASVHPSIPRALRDLLLNLVALAGQDALVVDDGGTGKALAGVRDVVPIGFAPVIILDASGRVSGTYKLWEEHRGNLVRLPSAANDYSAVEISVWRRPNGQKAYQPGPLRTELLASIAALINADRASRWLVFHFKADVLFGDNLRALVTHDAEGRVFTLAWGSHHGTNTYREITNVVVTGQLTYRRSAYLASAMAASGLPPKAVAELDLRTFEVAEFTRHLQQAIGRSNVRHSVNGKAGAARVYVVMSPTRPPTNALEHAFPGARIGVWKERERVLPTRARKVLAYIVERLSDPLVVNVSKAATRKATAIPTTSNLAKVISHPAFLAALEERSIAVRHRHFEREMLADD